MQAVPQSSNSCVTSFRMSISPSCSRLSCWTSRIRCTRWDIDWFFLFIDFFLIQLFLPAQIKIESTLLYITERTKSERFYIFSNLIQKNSGHIGNSESRRVSPPFVVVREFGFRIVKCRRRIGARNCEGEKTYNTMKNIFSLSLSLLLFLSLSLSLSFSPSAPNLFSKLCWLIFFQVLILVLSAAAIAVHVLAFLLPAVFLTHLGKIQFHDFTVSSSISLP